ncbi:hypothetical protein [Runella sp.]|uniref:hypothetical protein n=1 Tax=Runella sp. TaxID=1960881 RepID=UPI003D139894
MTYKTTTGEVLQGSTSPEILKGYQQTSKFDAEKSYLDFLNDVWQRLDEWEGKGVIKPEQASMDKYVLLRLIEHGFLIEAEE